VKTLLSNGPVLHRFSWSPTGDLLAAATAAGEVLVWNTGSGELSQVIRTGSPQVTHLAWSPDGDTIAIASSEIQFYSVS
jgi:WD40 repeat protein